MSNNIGTFEPIEDSYGESMTVTAFVGKDWDRSVQFTIGMEYCALNSNDVKCIIIFLDEYPKKDNTMMYTGKGVVVLSRCDNGKNVRFDINEVSCTLNTRKINRMLRILQKRLDGIKGFRATD